MSEQERQEIDNLEEEVFKALDHQIRRNVLRYIGESKKATFTEILNTVNIPRQPYSFISPKDTLTFCITARGQIHLIDSRKISI